MKWESFLLEHWNCRLEGEIVFVYAESVDPPLLTNRALINGEGSPLSLVLPFLLRPMKWMCLMGVPYFKVPIILLSSYMFQLDPWPCFTAFPSALDRNTPHTGDPVRFECRSQSFVRSFVVNEEVHEKDLATFCGFPPAATPNCQLFSSWLPPPLR